MRDELGKETSVIATGGMTHLVQEESRWIETTDPNLTLDGLYLVARKLGSYELFSAFRVGFVA